MKVLVTGGCGYKGAVLVPRILKHGHRVTVVDTQWFGKNLQEHPELDVICMDVREFVNDGSRLKPFDAVIHLAAIANDPCGELDARLTWDVNVLATYALAKAAERAGVKHFIFASSASIYGIKGNEPVNEETEFAPVSDYNKTKMVAEQLITKIGGDMIVTCVRPATICGVSPRMRFDVIVNMLTAQALERGRITAHCGAMGGKLMRPHMHIEDVCSLYRFVLENRIPGCYNAASENQEVGSTAALISHALAPRKVSIDISEVADKRSYAVDTSKLSSIGFMPKRTVFDAIRDLAKAWDDGLRPTPMGTNLKWMRWLGVAS